MNSDIYIEIGEATKESMKYKSNKKKKHTYLQGRMPVVLTFSTLCFLILIFFHFYFQNSTF